MNTIKNSNSPAGMPDGLVWNKCDVCGRFISMDDFESGKAIRRMLTPDSDLSAEEYETLCHKHRND